MIYATLKNKSLILLLAVLAILVSLGIWYIKNKTPNFKKSGDEFHFVANAKDYKYKVGHKESNKPLVELQGKNDTSLSFQLLDAGAESKEPIKKGNKIIFENILENVDLVYTTLKNGLKEEIVLHQNVGLSEFTFSLNVNNLQNEFVGNENLGGYFLDPSNDLGLYFEPPFAIDDAGNRTDEVKLQVYKSNQENVYTMKLIVDEEWLNSEERVYPITIDPTVIFSGYEEIEDVGINRGEINSSNEVDTSYKTLTTDENTIGLWHFDEGVDNTCSGGEDTCDSSGLGNHGTFGGDASFATTKVVGSNAITLGGTNGQISITDTALLRPTTITIEGWFNTSVSAADILLRKSKTTGASYIMYIGNLGAISTDDAGEISCGHNNGGWIGISSGGTFNDGNWHHAGCVFTGNEWLLYIDGRLEARLSSTTAIDYTGASTLYMGSTGAANYFTGQIDEFRLSNKAKTAEEIKQSASKFPYAVYTSPVLDAGEEITNWKDLAWTESGVATGDGETVYDSTSLVAQWNFNETSGTTANNDAEGTSCGGTPATCDGTLNGFDSTASQDADPDSSWTATERVWGAGALKFDGTNSYVNVPDTSELMLTGDFTISAWANRRGGTNGTIIAKKGAAGTGGFSILHGNAGEVYCRTDTGAANTNTRTGFSPYLHPSSGWVYITAVKSGSGCKVYINGIDRTVLSADHSTVGTNTLPLRIGSTSAGAEYFNGVIDSVQVYSRALSAEEIIANYNSSNVEFQVRSGPNSTPDDSWDEWKSTGTETQIEALDENSPIQKISQTNLIAHWKLDETSGTRNDSEGSNNLTDNATVLYGQGHLNNGADFEASNSEYLSITDNADLSVSDIDFSFTGWIKPEDAVNNNMIITKYTDTSTRDYQLYINASGIVEFNIFNSSGTAVGSTTASTHGALSIGTWYFIHAYHDATANTVGVSINNGTVDSSATTGVPADTAANVQIGARAGTLFFDGVIDEVSFWKRTLTTAEKTQLYIDGVDTRTVQPPIHQSLDSTIKIEGTNSEKIQLGKPQIDSNTLALYHLNETNGDNAGVDIFDATSNSFDLEIAGTNLASSVVGGIVDKGRDFNGTDDIASCTDASCGGASGFDTGSSDLTVSAWVKTTSTAIGGVASKMNSGGVDGWALGVEAAGTAKLWAYGGANSGRRSSVAVVNDGKWHHIAGVYDNAGTITMYVDGVVSQGTLSGTVPTSIDDSDADFSIGYGLAGIGYFDGNIDEVKIDKVARTAEEITEAYRMGRDHYLNKTIPAADLSDDSKVYFDIAADKPGTYLETTIGESAFVNNQSDANTVGLWRFEEIANNTCNTGTNDACDSSGNGNHGNETSSPPIVRGIIGTARNFDGSADYIQAPSSATNWNLSNNTISAWVYPTAYPGVTAGIFGHGGYHASPLGGWDMRMTTTGAINVNYYDSSTGSVLSAFTSTKVIPLNQWTHIALTIGSGTAANLYFNSVLDTTATMSTPIAVTNTLEIGSIRHSNCSGSPCYFFTGTIDEPRFDSAVRTAAEIRQTYENGLKARTHPITIDFAAGLENNLITGSGDLSFEIDATNYGLPEKGTNLYVGEKVIVKETVDATEYIAQGTVKSVQISNGSVWVNSWDTGSTFPSGGFTTNATVFKWQREYFDLSGISLDSFKDAITNVTFRVTNENEGRTVYIDNLGATTGYSTSSSSSTITSDTGNRYYQYRAILTSSDEGVSAKFSNLNIDYNTKSPEAYWKFDENYGSTAYDYESGGNNGTIAGAVWTPPGECLSNNCLYFDGANDTVQIADSDSLDFIADETFSFGGWFRTGAAEADILIAKKNTQTAADAGYMIHFTSTGNLRCYASDGTNQTAAASDATFQDNKWHQVMCVNDDTNLILYVDGNPVKTTALTATGSYANALPLVMGEQGNGAGDFTGFLDEMKVYRSAKTEAEIKQEYTARASVAGASASFSPTDSDFLSDGLVGYWKLNETSGTAADSSGNGLTLTNNGVTTFVVGKFGNGSEHVPASTQYLSTDTSISSVKSVSFWVNPDSTTNYYVDLNGSSYISSSAGTLSATGFTDATIYVNGVETTTIAADTWSLVTVTTDTPITASAFRIGRIASNYFDGTMDEVRVYNKKLSEREINSLSAWAPGPLAFWTLDENKGTATVYDKSGNGNNGTLNSITENSWVSGKYGAALNFDGVADYVTLPTSGTSSTKGNLGFADTDNFTISLWYKGTELGTGSSSLGKTLLGRDSGDIHANLTLNGGYVEYLHYDSAFLHNVKSTTNVADDKWHYITFINYSDETADIYIDGVKEVDKLSSSLSDAARYYKPDNIMRGYNADYTKGQVDEVKIYNYARTPSQIIQDMNGDHPVGGSPVGSQVIRYKFDEGNQSTAYNTISTYATITGAISGAIWKQDSDCKISGCLDFDGTDDVVTVTNTNAIDFDTGLSSAVTFTTWLNADTDGENDVGEIFDKGATTYCRTDSQGTTDLDLECSLDLGTTDATVNIADGLTTDTWHHIAMVYADDSDDEIEVYIDGILRGTSTDGVGSPATSDTNNLLIGGSSTANFDGSIDEFHLYSVPLTLEQVLVDRNAGSQASLGGVLGSSERTYVTDGAGNSPVAYWKFDENKGTTSIYDSSGNGYTGTMNGTMTEADWVAGKFGAALEFDGSDDDISLVANSPLFKNLGEFSISAWIYLNSATAENTVIQSSIDGGVHQARLDFRTTTSGELFCTARAPDSDAADSVTTTTASLTANTWYHVTCAMDVANDTIKVYVDGVLMDTTGTVAFTNAATSNTNPDSILIGQDTNGGQNMNGRIDELKLWEYELTPAQVAYEYNRGGPVGWWKLDEGTGTTTVYDSSGKGNHGTITGGAEADWVTGKFNTGFDLDGTGTYIDVGTGASLDITNQITISAWVKHASFQDWNVYVARGRSSCASPYVDYFLGTWDTSNNNKPRFALAIGGALIESPSSINKTLSTDTWYHITGTYDGSNLKLYVDGNLISTVAATGTIDDLSSNSLAIGKETTGCANNSSGVAIDDVRIYNYSLSADQIRNVMNLGAQSFR